ncbi:hypothetical protein KFL_008240040 [Klebsormidium nitens]|uniref:Helicase C-terminal domain-containing protein n=1 Tax=Klebsormidium nitens TaxID=105231 RepID=A0A1Y1ILX8_KLENI|nr:hypothetical protein KFL_008240040 [Klebsormidium nitens]|eukprot:GAQ91643.1 hypothetical protein KFL_008240040 [Klebsormidium nitens]
MGEHREMTEEIVLLPPQEPHVTRLLNILRHHAFALDLSALGAGKTFSGSKIALESGLPNVIVISPVSVQPKWQEMHEKYGVPIRHNLSYCGVRSVKGKQPKHGLLSRRDYTVDVTMPRGPPRQLEKTDFQVTDTFKLLLGEGVLLIVDEMQHLKNVSSQFAACQTLIKAVTDSYEAGGRSRALLLSGSPIDKQEQAVTLFRTLNVMQHPDLGPEAEPLEHDAALALAGTLLKLNAFYRIDDEEDRKALSAGVQALEYAVHYDRRTGRVSMAEGADSLRALCAALVKIESSKVRTFARVALKALRSNSQQKVVICVNYNDSLQSLQDLLAAYSPLVLNGAVPKQERKHIIDKFQLPADEHRVLLGNVSVCSTGIDLDDKDGAWPRLALISPNYSTLTLYQLGHRFQRMDTKSEGTVHMVFAKHAHELPILNALSRKGAVMRETTPEQVNAGIKFPGDFPSWVEEDLETSLMRSGFKGFKANRERRKWARSAKGIKGFRPDFIFVGKDFVVILEVDEDMHRHYECRARLNPSEGRIKMLEETMKWALSMGDAVKAAQDAGLILAYHGYSDGRRAELHKQMVRQNGFAYETIVL